MSIFAGPRSNNSSRLKTGNVQSQPIPKSVNNGKQPFKLNFDVNTSNNNKVEPKLDSSVLSQNSHKRDLTKFEESSNISQQRPEILMMTNFNPLYKNAGEKTEFGDLFDINIETLRQLDASAQKLLNDLNEKDVIDNKNKNLKDQITILRNYLSELSNVLKILNTASSNLNFHNAIYNFSPVEFSARMFNDDGTQKTSKSSLDPFVQQLPETLNLDLALKNSLNLEENSSNKYTSTKLWLTAVNELRQLLLSYSRRITKTSDVFSDENSSKLADYSEIDKSRIAFNFIEKNGKVPEGVVFTASDSSYSTVEYSSLKSSMEAIDSILYEKIKDSESIISLIFHLISKEIRQSLCTDTNSDSFKFFSTSQNIASVDSFFDSIFGIYPTNQDVFKINPKYGVTLTDFPYARNLDDSTKAVLTIEEKEPSNISTNLVAGGNYFFNEEAIFDNISQKTLNLKRLEEIQKSISALDTNFFNIMANFGMMSVDDSVFNTSTQNNSSDKQTPSFVSLNPVTFINNVTSLMVDKYGISTIYGREADDANFLSAANNTFKQKERGVGAIFELAGRNTDVGRSVRAALLLVVFEMIYSLDSSLGKFDKNLLSSLQSFSINNTPDIEQQITKDKSEVANWIADTLKPFVNAKKDALGETAKLYKNTFQTSKDGETGLFKYVPCKYDDETILGDAIRKSPFVFKIATVIKETISVFQQYACKGEKYSSFQGISFDTISVLFFNAICMLCSQFSDNKIVAAHKDEIPVNLVAQQDNKVLKNGQSGLSSQEITGLNSTDLQTSLNWLGFCKYQLVLYANIESIPRDKKKLEISSLAQQEMLNLISVSTAILNILDTLNANIKTIYTTVTKFNQDAIGYLLRYLNEDKEKLSLVLKEPQLMLLLSNVEDLYQSFNDFSEDVNSALYETSNLFTKQIETLSHSPKIVDTLESFFNDQQYTFGKGYNKKIISIGIPQGLFRNILNDASLNSKSDKHNDIFKIVIHKMDLVNGEIVYIPKEYLFEASRYPVRLYSSIKQFRGGDTQEIFKSFLTRNYSLFFDRNVINAGAVAYWDDKSGAFGDEYSFLSDSEKNEIIENHITSFLLENYLKVSTGLMINENSFNVNSNETLSTVDPAFKQTIKNNVLLKATIKSNLIASLQNKANLVAPRPRNASMRLTFTQDQYKKIVETNSDIDQEQFIEAAASMLPPPDMFITKIIQPKKFDRVFNVIFDPEFQVDYEKTNATSAGRQRLNKLINEGKIYKTSNTKNEYADVDKSFHDPSLDTFFVSIETHAEKIKLSNSALLKDVKFNTVSNISSEISGMIMNRLNKAPQEKRYRK